MKTLLTVFTLVFIEMFSSTSFAGWKKVETNSLWTLRELKKHDGFVYFWGLYDYLKTNKYGNLSDKVSHQGDGEPNCRLQMPIYSGLRGS